MTSKNTWDPSKLDDIKDTAERLIKQFPPSPSGATDSFYNSQDDIRATKSDLEVDSTVSDAPDKSSGKKGEGYRPKPSENKNEEYQSKPETEKEKKKGK